MCLCSEQMTFLASSQTFLGVLVTLLVLCLFYDGAQTSSDDSSVYNAGGNNFLSRIIHNEIWLINQRISNRSQKIKNKLDDIMSCDNLKILSKWINANSLDETQENEEAYQAVFGINKKANELQSVILSDQYDALKQIELSNEQFRAPLFMLVYGIVIFCIDELYTVFPDIRDGLNLFVLTLTLLSVIYWAAVWIKYLCRNIDKVEDSCDINTHNDWFIRIQAKLGPSIFGLLLLFGILTIAIIVSITIESIITSAGITLGTGTYALSFLIFTVLIITILGVWRLCECSIVGNYSYSHVLGHFLVILLYSIITSVFISWQWGNGTEWWGSEIAVILRESAVVFVLVNGLILPFLLPYCKVMSVYRHAKKSLNQSDRDAIEFEAEVRQKTSGLFKKIVASTYCP